MNQERNKFGEYLDMKQHTSKKPQIKVKTHRKMLKVLSWKKMKTQHQNVLETSKAREEEKYVALVHVSEA